MSTIVFELAAGTALLAVVLAILEKNARGVRAYLRTSDRSPLVPPAMERRS